MTKKRVLIINTGGTISSTQSKSGYAPKSGFLSGKLSSIPELIHDDMPAYALLEFDPLLDSSNIDVSEWYELAQIIESHYDEFDGFVILHGTDTLAYTASALSFICENLTKPIIVTGSQLPLSDIRTDGKDNLITALWLAQSDKLHEVFVYFNQKLLRGNRAQKISSSRFSAFGSPTFPTIATCGTQVDWKDHLLLKKTRKKLKIHPIHNKVIANFRLFPGCHTHLIKYLLAYPLEGLILETFGSGNAKTNTDFLKVLKVASDKGIIIVNCSQCHQGKVNMHTYATGKALALAGLADGGDMTAEAAHTKLLFLLTNQKDKSTIPELMEKNLRGERSE